MPAALSPNDTDKMLDQAYTCLPDCVRERLYDACLDALKYADGSVSCSEAELSNIAHDMAQHECRILEDGLTAARKAALSGTDAKKAERVALARVA